MCPRRLEIGKAPVGRQRDAQRCDRRRLEAAAVLVDGERRDNPETRRLAERRVEPGRIRHVEKDDAVAGRKRDIPHRRERHAHEDVQALALRPREDLNQHIRRDVVRGQPDQPRPGHE